MSIYRIPMTSPHGKLFWALRLLCAVATAPAHGLVHTGLVLETARGDDEHYFAVELWEKGGVTVKAYGNLDECKKAFAAGNVPALFRGPHFLDSIRVDAVLEYLRLNKNKQYHPVSYNCQVFTDELFDHLADKSTLTFKRAWLNDRRFFCGVWGLSTVVYLIVGSVVSLAYPDPRSANDPVLLMPFTIILGHLVFMVFNLFFYQIAAYELDLRSWVPLRAVTVMTYGLFTLNIFSIAALPRYSGSILDVFLSPLDPRFLFRLLLLSFPMFVALRWFGRGGIGRILRLLSFTVCGVAGAVALLHVAFEAVLLFDLQTRRVVHHQYAFYRNMHF